MQTDPNWSNFFYESAYNRINLLDFGACRNFPDKFINDYIETIAAATRKDRDACLKYSRQLGFLTGEETQIMNDAHIDAVLILGEPFASDEPYDFQKQNITSRIHKLIPTMLKYRLKGPPEDTYSLHRKLSGTFLLCTKLNAKINCKEMFDSIYQKYKSK